MFSVDWFRHSWLALGIVAALWGVATLTVELIALFNDRPDDTLSEVMWSLHVPHFLFFMAFGFLGWVFVHFLSGGKWGI